MLNLPESQSRHSIILLSVASCAVGLEDGPGLSATVVQQAAIQLLVAINNNKKNLTSVVSKLCCQCVSKLNSRG